MGDRMTDPPLLLASASPRRQALLRAAAVNFEVLVSGIDESAHQAGEPCAVVLQTALAKAEAVAVRHGASHLILAADTMVVLEGRVFNKPADREDARAMLRQLSGRTHTVLTALALLSPTGQALSDVVAAEVTFNSLDEAFIATYVGSGETDDKAGAYGIQGLGARLVATVTGDLTCVIGLPLTHLGRMFQDLTGRDLFAGQSPRTIALSAFPDLAGLPPDCLRGIPG